MAKTPRSKSKNPVSVAPKRSHIGQIADRLFDHPRETEFNDSPLHGRDLKLRQDLRVYRVKITYRVGLVAYTNSPLFEHAHYGVDEVKHTIEMAVLADDTNTEDFEVPDVYATHAEVFGRKDNEFVSNLLGDSDMHYYAHVAATRIQEDNPNVHINIVAVDVELVPLPSIMLVTL